VELEQKCLVLDSEKKCLSLLKSCYFSIKVSYGELMTTVFLKMERFFCRKAILPN
jgi:hypothetical protein